MLLKRLGLLLALVLLTTTTVFAGATSAQTAVEVSITDTSPGSGGSGCPPGPTLLSSPPSFELTRTGDTTDPLEVTISWSGSIATDTTVTPSVAEFAAGSPTTTVTPVVSSVPVIGTLSLTVVSGAGYQVGDPATLDATFDIALALCAAPPSAPPPVVTGPNFTG
jgi:hypothetical protein